MGWLSNLAICIKKAEFSDKTFKKRSVNFKMSQIFQKTNIFLLYLKISANVYQAGGRSTYVDIQTQWKSVCLCMLVIVKVRKSQKNFFFLQKTYKICSQFLPWLLKSGRIYKALYYAE